jgi:hypothetical protein
MTLTFGGTAAFACFWQRTPRRASLEGRTRQIRLRSGQLFRSIGNQPFHQTGPQIGSMMFNGTKAAPAGELVR